MMSIPAFNERKASQLAAYLLSKSSDGELFLLKLMKLMYLVDREAMSQFGHPVTYDQYVSMRYGPVLSNVYGLMNGMTKDREGEWDAMISAREGHKLQVTDDCEMEIDALSEAELSIADRIFDEFGHMQRFNLAELTHEFEEWTDPGGSATPISYQEILRAVGYEEDEIREIMVDLHTQHEREKLFEYAASDCLEGMSAELKQA